MIDINRYIAELTEKLENTFAERLLYVGLQGSYLRGEANGNSDIDIMAVIDGLDAADLAAYRSVVENMEHYDRSCGFICGREELANWNPLEIFHVLNCTKDCYGTLAELVPTYTADDIRNFVKVSADNMYHELCHRYIHSDAVANAKGIIGTYKGVFFILQNLYYIKTGRYVSTKAQMLTAAEGLDREVMERAMALSRGEHFDFEDNFGLLFEWCCETVKTV